MSTFHACLVPDNFVVILVLQPMAKWLASALPVADMYATAQYVMAQTVPLMRRLAFYDQFIEDYRGSQVYAHWCVYKRHRPL